MPRKPCAACGLRPKRPGRGYRYCEECEQDTHVPSIPAETQAAMVRAYNRPRATLAEVAAAFFCSPLTVRRVLAANGATPRPRGHGGTPRISVEEELRRTQLYGRGLSIADVAEIVGRSSTAVVATLQRAGVKMHPVGVNVHERASSERRHRERDSRGRFTPRSPSQRRVPPRAAERPHVVERGDSA